MGRVVTMNKTLIPADQRAQYLEHVRKRRDHYRAGNCNFWVFEEAGQSGSFLEFTEAKDVETLTGAVSHAPGVTAGIPRVYQEVEIG